MTAAPRIVVVGAAGLIGSFILHDLRRRGLTAIGVGRRFTPADRDALGPDARELPVANLDAEALKGLLRESGADVVINCLGVLQDTPADSTADVHLAFVARLIEAMRALARPALLVHFSIPGAAADDRTAFARSKRAAEAAIASSGIAHAILRPGFVLAPNAYGGSAMLRALAAMPFDLPRALAARPFAYVAAEDIAETVAVVAARWRAQTGTLSVGWDLMHPDVPALGEAADRLRAWLGAGGRWRVRLPQWALSLGARSADAAAWLGWRPPTRSTAIAELRRGVTGDPRPWMQATGVAPRSLDALLRARPATVQEKWFARLYALKALVLAVLVVFWCASALIALTVAYPEAVAILTAYGYPEARAQVMTIAGSVMDFAVGVAIAFRRTSRFGLWAGIAVSLFYMAAAAVLTPALWVEPLGALVKTGPAIVLMMVALAIADDR